MADDTCYKMLPPTAVATFRNHGSKLASHGISQTSRNCPNLDCQVRQVPIAWGVDTTAVEYWMKYLQRPMPYILVSFIGSQLMCIYISMVGPDPRRARPQCAASASVPVLQHLLLSSLPLANRTGRDGLSEVRQNAAGMSN